MTTANSLTGFRVESNPSKVDLVDVSNLLEVVGMRARSIDAMERAIEASTEVVVVHDDRETLVGFGRLVSDGMYYGTLWDIAVHPNFQKLGVGKAIVARLLATCRNLELTMVGLFTAQCNREFYESSGFAMLDCIHAMTLDLNSLSLEKGKDMDRNLLGIVVTEFSSDISEAMLTTALDEAAILGAEIVTVSRVRGAYEIPLITEELLKNAGITSVVALGFIEKGETQHGEVMAHTVSTSLLNSSVKHGKAIGYGLIGPGASLEQANHRKEPYARAAVRAAVASTSVLRNIRQRVK